MVFQHHSLFEHLSAVNNVWLAPVHVRRVPQPEAERRALALLDELGVGHRAGRCLAKSPAARRSAWPSHGRSPWTRPCC